MPAPSVFLGIRKSVGAASSLQVLEVVVVLGVGMVHGARRVTGGEQPQLNDVFDQAGVVGRPVVLGEYVFGSHADTPVRLQ